MIFPRNISNKFMTVEAMQHKQNAALSIACYCLASIIMTVTNKLVLSSYEFKMNFLLLAIQVKPLL